MILSRKILADALSRLIILPFLLTCACSHTTAYIRPGVPAIAEPVPREDQVGYRVILIGDAGEPDRDAPKPVLELLRERAARSAAKTTVLVLGDNIYPAGLPAEGTAKRKEAEKRLTPQINAIKKSGANGVIIPGNHDWDNSKAGGLAAINRQESLVVSRLGDGAFLPEDGCPGPVKLDLPGIRLIILDTQWWLHKHEKPLGACFGETTIRTEQQAKERFIVDVAALIASAGDRTVVLAAHHPLDTHGPHGGFYDWTDHIFPLTNLVDWLWLPLPVIGSLYPLGRQLIVKSDQDLVGDKYKELMQSLSQAIEKAGKPVIFAAGHDHALQVLQGEGQVGFILVSGLGSPDKATKVGHGDNTLFAHVQPGFMELDYLHDGRVYLRVIERDNSENRHKTAFSYWLVK